MVNRRRFKQTKPLYERLADEAALIPRRTAIVERLHEREQQKTEDGDVDK